jgi:thiol-disulfide isomerase/thioredoxin
LLVSREAEPLFDLHLGLVYADLGMEPQALEHLGRGLAMGASEEPATDAEAREVAEGLFSKLRWAVGGFDDWLATRLPDRFRGAEPLPPEHLNVGATFPDLPVRVDGEDLALSDFPGLRVIDVWASTCDACTATLDAYNRVASAWEGRGFHFLLLSVDDRRWQVESFWEDAPPRSFDVAWAGEGALEELDLPGLSTVFIVDEDGKVLACIPRYRGEQDGRLAQRLEALVRPPAP